LYIPYTFALQHHHLIRAVGLVRRLVVAQLLVPEHIITLPEDTIIHAHILVLQRHVAHPVPVDHEALRRRVVHGNAVLVGLELVELR
jgi:hypothetical protein